MPCRGRPGDQRVHRADGRLHRGAVLDDPRRRRRGAGPGPAPAPPQLRDPPRRPGTGPRPVPVPRVRVPPDRPAPHPALGQRRPHRPGQPDQLVPLAPQGGPRPRLHHRRPARRRASRSTARTARPLPSSPPLPEPDGRSARPTTRTSPRTRSSRPGTASASTWTTPSGPASPTPAPTRKNKPTGSRPRSRLPAGHMGRRLQRHGRLHPPLLRGTPGRLIVPRSTLASPFSDY